MIDFFVYISTPVIINKQENAKKMNKEEKLIVVLATVSRHYKEEGKKKN